MGIVRLEQVSKSFGSGHFALKDFDLTVQPGEIVAITGPSGSGKTTLLRLVAGLESPTSGKIWIDERAGSSLLPQERNVSMVFQQSVLMPHLTAGENMMFSQRVRRGFARRLASMQRGFGDSELREVTGGSPAGILSDRTGSEVRDRLRQVSEMLEVDHLLERWPWQLSGGERQRVAFGRAMVRRPVAFLLDEPFSNLDVILRRQLQRRLRDALRAESAAVMLVTHDGSDVLTLADRVAVLREGRLEQVGSTDELQAEPRSPFVRDWLAALFGRDTGIQN